MKIAIKSVISGQYFCVDMDKKGNPVLANRDNAGPWETFELFVVNEDGSLVPIDDVIIPPDNSTPPPPDENLTDDIVLTSATIASGDCPDVRGWPVLSNISNITITQVNSEGQGYAMNFPGRDTWVAATPPGWDGGINHTLWMGLKISGQWYILPVKEGLGTYLELGPILMEGQIPDNLTYYSIPPMLHYQPMPNEQVAFFCTTGDTRRMNVQAGQVGRTNVRCVPYKAGNFTW